MPTIGNDIVDLNAPENIGKSRNRRFLERVFTPEELTFIRRAADPDACLWAIWAAKEGAYKALNKKNALLTSIPRRYAVSFSGESRQMDGLRNNAGLGEIVLTGEVDTPEERVCFRTAWTADYVHCLVFAGAGPSDPDVSECIWNMRGVNDLSQGLKQAALVPLASLLDAGPSDIEIRRMPTALGAGPPQVWVKGEPASIDISLTHDGIWGAAAFYRFAA